MMPTPSKKRKKKMIKNKNDKKCDNRVMKKVGGLANKYESLLTKAEKFHLTNIFFSTSNFHGLPRFINLNK